MPLRASREGCQVRSWTDESGAQEVEGSESEKCVRDDFQSHRVIESPGMSVTVRRDEDHRQSPGHADAYRPVRGGRSSAGAPERSGR